MQWEKLGLIYQPPNDGSWRDNSALTPTPLQLNEDIIRIYFGARDSSGKSRITFVDLDADDPTRIVHRADSPIFELGRPGAFDDSGAILGDMVRVGEKIYCYYVGFQIVDNVKFLAFTGLAISTDNGETFTRFSDAPVLDRSHEGIYIRAIHTAIRYDDHWKIWYAAGNAWNMIDGKPFPNYAIYYQRSENGFQFNSEGVLCMPCQDNEYRIGRPRVYQSTDGFEMFYTAGTLEGSYLANTATSIDGVLWQRTNNLGIELAEDGWDSKHLCYPCVFHAKGKTYMVYNGNNMGVDGFGIARKIV